jgi:sugar lactone lactonase YvrE
VGTVSAGHGFPESPAIAADGVIDSSDPEHGPILRFDPATGTITTWNDGSRRPNVLFLVGDTLYARETAGRAVGRYDLARRSTSGRVPGPTCRPTASARFTGISCYVSSLPDHNLASDLSAAPIHDPPLMR